MPPAIRDPVAPDDGVSVNVLLSFALSVIFGLMLAELVVARRNESALLTRGAVIPRGDVWFGMATVYPLAFVLMGVEGLRWPPGGSGGPNWFAAGLLLLVASKALKYWAVWTLGERWTFRILVLPGAPLVAAGPYRYVTHPNYIAVVGELVGTAMMMRARITGPAMTVLFGFVLWARIRFENRVLEAIRQRQSS